MCAVRPLLVFVGIACLFACSAAANPASRLRNPEFMKAADHGFGQALNLDFDDAARTFSALAGQYPGHPAPPLYLASIIWLRQLDERHELVLERLVHPSYFGRATSRAMAPALRQEFFELTGKSKLQAERWLKDNPQDRDAEYFRGASEGLLAAFALTEEHSYLRALGHAKQAYSIHRRLIDDDRQYYDARIFVGLYEYMAGSLPWYLRWLGAVAGIRGDRQSALESLTLAVEKGTYASDEARVLRMAVLAREERARDAGADARVLLGRYPHNCIFHVTEAQMLNRAGDRAEAADAYAQVLHFAEQGKPNYQRIDLAALRWELAGILLALKPQAALESYRALLRDPASGERWRVLSALRSGCALDLLGRRDEAIREYHSVLSMQDYDNAHNSANEYLRRPCTAGPNPIRLLRASPK